RTLAALRDDVPWFEEATKNLLAAGVDAAEQPSLWFELGRIRLLSGDDAGAAEAFASLAGVDAEGSSAWLGRALGAYALGLGPRDPEEGEAKPRSPDAIEELAKVETEPMTARALWVVSAMRSARAGDVGRARARLRELHQAQPSDQ